jgi:carbamoylphosphate synthase small subunit
VAMTAVQIGNYGVNAEDAEAAASKASGFVVRELSPVVSNWRSQLSLGDYLKKYGIPGISEVDTRALTKKLRVQGSLKCCLSTLPLTDEEAVQHGFEVLVLPAGATAEQVKEHNPDAVFLSNGPGDPAALPYIHQTVTTLLPDYPIFGICLGHQMLTHALGGTTFKLKFGHRGGNQPVKNLETGKVSITAQNHGFATDPKSIENRGAQVTEINLNDQTVEGLRHKELPVFCVQYHPEAAPGPNDADPLFVDFYKMVEKRKAGKI